MAESLKQQILGRYQASFDNLKEKRILWDRAEKLFHNQLNDAVSMGAKSQVFDPKLSTLTLERSYRVMAQTQTGKVIATSRNDTGTGKLMNLILDKYVIPNANAQFDFLTKMRMVNAYSNIYGVFFTLTDWDIKPNGYVGPDVWLLNIRDVFSQVGAVSLEDSEHVIIRTWKPLSYFERIAKQQGFRNVGKIIEKLKDKSGSKENRDSENISKREESQYPEQRSAKKSGFFEVLTQFERDRWVDYCVDADMEFRDVANPHDDGELPVNCKYSIPLLDDFMGMGDFERGGSMQMALNANWNLYFDAIKMSTFPPMMINKDAVSSMSSLKYQAAAKWLMRSPVGVAGAAPANISPQGINTFNNTYQVANAAILNLFGTTDTATTTQTDPAFGRTPQAIAQQRSRENSRDNADRFHQEQYLTKIMKKMANLIGKKQNSAITVRMFSEEIEDLARSYPDVRDMYDEKTGKLTIDKKNIGSVKYDYEIVSGSTYAVDQKAQQDNLQLLLQMYLKSQGPQGNSLVADLQKEGYEFKFGELFKQVVSMMGLPNWQKILVEMTDGERADSTLSSHAQEFMKVLAAAQQGGQMNAVPPQPNTMENPMGQGSQENQGAQFPLG